MMDRPAPTLPPDVLESIVNALAERLNQDYRERWSLRGAAPNRVRRLCQSGEPLCV